jgi:hypothetical protein
MSESRWRRGMSKPRLLWTELVFAVGTLWCLIEDEMSPAYRRVWTRGRRGRRR